ncbi:MAG: tetratricopeptide repeat protein, partial [Myxococcota bacterium]
SGLAGPDAARVRWLTWAGVDPRRAVAAARRAATARSDMALVVAEADFERGRAIELSSSTLPDALWRARRNRLRAAVALKEGQPGDALDLARAAARQDPKNAAGVAKIVEAMLAEGEASRARAFAEVLLERRPIDVNPYDSLLAVHRAEASQQPEAFKEPGPALEVRHRAWTEARARLDRARARRERLLGAVRDADSGLKATGLTAARTADPTLGLPIDIALAKYGAAGTARAARDRILAACGRHFRDWLTRRGDWDRVKVTVSPYRRSRTVRVALSDADPGRCPPPTLKARAIRNRGRL